MKKSTSSSAARHVRASALRDSGKDSLTPAAASCLTMLESLGVTDLGTLSGKMSPVSSHQTEEGILEPSSGRWGTWGMTSPTGFLTLNGSEHNSFQTPSHSVDGVCSLSDVLEREVVPPRYFLSPKACAGILRRAEKRGKALPEMLHRALLAVVEGSSEQENPEDKTQS